MGEVKMKATVWYNHAMDEIFICRAMGVFGSWEYEGSNRIASDTWSRA